MPTRIGARNRDGMPGNSTRPLLLHVYAFGFRDHILARVGRGLHPEEAGITAIELHELRVRALLDEAAVLEEDDRVRAAHSREPVRDVNRGAPTRERTQPLEQVVLGLRIQRRRWFVEEQDLRVAHERSRERDLLPLATRQVHPVVEPLAQRGVVAVGKPDAWLSRT